MCCKVMARTLKLPNTMYLSICPNFPSLNDWNTAAIIIKPY